MSQWAKGWATGRGARRDSVPVLGARTTPWCTYSSVRKQGSHSEREGCGQITGAQRDSHGSTGRHRLLELVTSESRVEGRVRQGMSMAGK